MQKTKAQKLNFGPPTPIPQELTRIQLPRSDRVNINNMISKIFLIPNPFWYYMAHMFPALFLHFCVKLNLENFFVLYVFIVLVKCFTLPVIIKPYSAILVNIVLHFIAVQWSVYGGTSINLRGNEKCYRKTTTSCFNQQWTVESWIVV